MIGPAAHPVRTVEACALCAEIGIRSPAVDDVPVPGTGGSWAFVCAAHRYRIESEARANTRLLLSAVRAPTDREVAS